MKEYAVIDSGTVGNIIAIDDGSTYPITNNMVDITNLVPQPQIGYSYLEGTFTSPPLLTLTTQQYADLAKQAGEDYINTFFSIIELLSIFQMLLQGNNTQKTMAASVQSWVNQVIAEAINHSSNPNFTQFTPPPHTYLEIVSAT